MGRMGRKSRGFGEDAVFRGGEGEERDMPMRTVVRGSEARWRAGVDRSDLGEARSVGRRECGKRSIPSIGREPEVSPGAFSRAEWTVPALLVCDASRFS